MSAKRHAGMVMCMSHISLCGMDSVLYCIFASIVVFVLFVVFDKYFNGEHNID